MRKSTEEDAQSGVRESCVCPTLLWVPLETIYIGSKGAPAGDVQDGVREPNCFSLADRQAA